jgi:GT2 family glycosyltransferase
MSTKPAADLCVVVVNYGTPHMAIECLDTLLHQVRELEAIVALVDNDSPDDSVVKLKRWISDAGAHDCVQLIESHENRGFAAGNNIGIESCDARMYLLLNSDTLVEEGALARLVEAISSEPDVGLAGPRLLWASGEPVESCFRYHRPISELIDSAGTGYITTLFARYAVPMKVSEERTFPEWTTFACVMIRREVIEQIGNLDEGFFMYFEDAEFAFRARQAGWRTLHEPTARVVHLHGGSSTVKSQERLRKRLPRYVYESRTRYFYKVFGRSGLLAANCCWTLGWTISSLRWFLQKNYRRPACEAQWRDIWTNFWTPMAPYTHPQSKP